MNRAALWFVVAAFACGVEESPPLDRDSPCARCCDGSVAQPDAASPPDSKPVTKVCYPGDGIELCLPVYALDPLPDELVYDVVPDDSYFQNHPEVSRYNYRPATAFLDLEEAFATYGDDVRLYPNFALREIGQERVGRWAVIQPHAFAHLQALRNGLGPTVVISGYRSPGYNEVGGGAGRAEASRHMWGDAFDFRPAGSLQQAAAECDRLGAYFINLYETHVHCDWRHVALDTRFFGEVDPDLDPSRGARMMLSGSTDPWNDYAASIQHLGAGLIAEYSGFDEGVPLIEWSAVSATGDVLATGAGSSFVPPPGAVRAQATVGGWLITSVELPSVER